ncbi:hypothetical protein RB595_008099 [Gaeumannomyces hyphopodioides]
MNTALLEETDPLLGDVAANRVRHAVTVDPDAPTEERALMGEQPLDFGLGDADPDDPMNWAPAYKWFIVSLLALMAFAVTFTCISLVPIASRIASDLDGEDNHDRGGEAPSVGASAALLVTIWELGEAVGPVLIAPLSEIHGRRPVLNAANCLFVAATALAALCHRTELFIGARALTGLAVASNVLNPAIVGDMFPHEGRGAAMSACMLTPLLGGAVGPAIGGAVAQTIGWRAVIWLSVGISAVCSVLLMLLLRETYKPVILRRRAERARGEGRLKQSLAGERAYSYGATTAGLVAHDQESEKSGAARLTEAIMRPAIVWSGSGVLIAMAVFNALGFAYFYILSVSLPVILDTLYGMSPAETGASLLILSSGEFLALFILNQTLDRLYVKLRNANDGVGRPEYRLPIAVAGALVMPIAIAAYGWAAEYRAPLPVLLAASAFVGFSLLICSMPITAYVVDAFGEYSASALTGVMVCRCLAGTFLPLTIAPLTGYLGWGWGFMVLAGASLAVAPIPILIMRYGPRWRMRSKYSQET